MKTKRKRNVVKVAKDSSTIPTTCNNIKKTNSKAAYFKLAIFSDVFLIHFIVTTLEFLIQN